VNALSRVGRRELDEFPWGLAGSDDTSMTQMGVRSSVTSGAGYSWQQSHQAVKKGLDDCGFGRNDMTGNVGWWLFLDYELIRLECKVFWNVTPCMLGDRHERF
jgi:hypothetical protein